MKKQNDQGNFDISKEQLTSVVDAAQTWIKEHKVVSALAAAAVLYLIGGRRVRSLVGMALKSGATAGLANAALSTVLPSATPEKTVSPNSSYH